MDEASGKRQFEALLVKVLDSLYSFAFSLTRDPDEASDLVQDGAIRAFQRFEQFQVGTNFKAWIFTITRHLFINKVRRQKRGGGAPVSLAEVAERLEAPDRELGPGDGEVDEEYLLSQVLDQEVKAAVDSLPEEFRTAVLLSDCEGLTYEEIAEVMTCPIGTVRSRLHRGRGLLKKELLDYAKREGYVKRSAE